MIKIENVSTVGWEPAIRGARNPMNSWEKSDTLFYNIRSDHAVESLDGEIIFYNNELGNWIYCGSDKKKPLYSWAIDNSDNKKVSKSDTKYFTEYLDWCKKQGSYVIGPNDLKLLTNLAKAGSDEAKFRRMIVVYLDVTAPMYWWKEADTYKVGTVRDSCSTMHKIHAKEFTLEDFSTEHLFNEKDFITGDKTVPFENDPALSAITVDGDIAYFTSTGFVEMICDVLNHYRDLFLKTHDKKYWWQMIQLLPSSYNQRATLMLNYEVLANMYHARKNHKLDEWRVFCKWIETLSYAKELIIGEETVTDTEEQIRARFKSYEDRIRYLEELSAKEFYRAYDMNISDISERLGIPESAVKYFVSDDVQKGESDGSDK